MADQPDKSSKTQPATPKKLADARKKGDIPTSRETGNLMLVLAFLALAVFVFPRNAAQLVETLGGSIAMAGAFSVASGQAGLTQIGEYFTDFTGALLEFLMPVFGVFIIGAVSGVLIQGETVVALERIKPKFSKISPVSGLKRLFSMNTLVEFSKNVTKVVIVGVIALTISHDAVKSLLLSYGHILEGLPIIITGWVVKLLIATVVLLFPVAVADILWQRYSWQKKQMMSEKEVRDEFKDSEGDPLIRSKRAAIRRDRAQQRLVHIIPKATIIITNPTHFAIALKYERGIDIAPVCVAKGADKMAQRIRSIAAENDIPLVENKLLARSLYSLIEIDEMIPIEHWKIVAELIGYVENFRKNRNQKPPRGSKPTTRS
jgi:flagellar biosynthetic protein FlhB